MRHRSPTNTQRALLVGLSAAALVGISAWIAVRPSRPLNPDKRRPDMPSLAGGRGMHVERTVTVLRPVDELYAEWRDLAHWPAFVPTLQSVTPLDGKRSHWVARGPAGMPVEWDAEVVAEDPNRLIAWRSIGDPDVVNAGSVRFTPAPGGRGTEVKVILTYSPPAGRIGAAVATIFGKSADRQVREGLRRFKQRMETHEIAVSGAPESSESTSVRRVA
jgi:uncharacterized membrane protein